MERWNVAGLVINPKGRRLNAKLPIQDVNCVYCLFPSATPIWWKPDFRSKVEKIVAWASPNEKNMSDNIGMGYGSGRVTALTARKSITGLGSPDFLKTMSIGLDQGELEGSIISLSSKV